MCRDKHKCPLQCHGEYLSCHHTLNRPPGNSCQPYCANRTDRFREGLCRRPSEHLFSRVVHLRLPAFSADLLRECTGHQKLFIIETADTAIAPAVMVKIRTHASLAIDYLLVG